MGGLAPLAPYPLLHHCIVIELEIPNTDAIFWTKRIFINAQFYWLEFEELLGDKVSISSAKLEFVIQTFMKRTLYK